MATTDGRPDPILRLLLEVWLEGREVVGAPRLVRARIRNLITGHDRAVKTPTELTAFVEEQLDDVSNQPRTWGGP